MTPRGAKNGPPKPPSGAKPWGGRGAPPTTLILLRNQRAAHATSFAEPRRGRSGAAGAGPPALAGPEGQNLPKNAKFFFPVVVER